MKSVNTVQNRFLRLYIVNLVSVPLRFIVFKKTALMRQTDRHLGLWTKKMDTVKSNAYISRFTIWGRAILSYRVSATCRR